MKVAFAGTPEFARQALAAIAQAGLHIPLVLTQPDRPAGRGMKLQASPVKQLAQSLNIPVLQPQSLRKGEESEQAIATLSTCCDGQPPDVLVVAAYGLILPQVVLDIPARGCLNIHASLLPRWRGAAPIHRAIEAGDRETGITIMQMDAGLDTGDMLLINPLPIDPSDTTATLHDKLASLGGQAIVHALNQLKAGQLHAVPQPPEGITYAHKIAKEEAFLDWSKPAETLALQLRAFDPFPGGVAELVDLKNQQASSSDKSAPVSIKLWAGHALPANTPAAPGEILAIASEGLDVACGDQVLRITELQKPGGKRLNVSDCWQQLGLRAGDRFKTHAGQGT